MGAVPLYHGGVIKGKFIPDYPDALKRAFEAMNGRLVSVSVRPYKPKRSGQQNSYYWAVVIDRISRRTGYSPDEAHSAMKWQHLKVHRDNLPPTVRSTTSLSTAEMTEYIEACRRWAAEFLDEYIPDPDGYDFTQHHS